MSDIRNNRLILTAPRRNWCFTLNNPEDPLNTHATFGNSIQIACGKRFRYLVFQLEKCPTTGTLHYQGYLELRTTVRISWLIKNLFQAHWSSRLGSREQARDYCMKADTRVDGTVSWECGDFKAGGQGARTDLQMVAASVQSGAVAEVIAGEFPALWIKYSRGIRSLINILQPARAISRGVTVYLCYGTTGTGKTRWAHESFPRLYKKPCDTRWFDGYSSQETVLLDDFSGAASKMSLNYVLQLLDRYPLLVEIKGDYTQLVATNIVITTNIHPHLWYSYSKRESQYHALARRVTKVLWFKKFGEHPVEVSHGFFFENYWDGCPDAEYLLQKTQPMEETDSQLICSESDEEPDMEIPDTPTED